MVTAALDALVGAEADDETVARALGTVPAAELPEALRLLARVHGPAALPVLRRCLEGRVEWAVAAAGALATLPLPEAAALLVARGSAAGSRAVRDACRRALYRLRQAGVTPPSAPAAPQRAAAPEIHRARATGVDGSGVRWLWLLVVEADGGHTLLTAAVSDQEGLLDGAALATAKKRVEDFRRRVEAESPLPWVELPPAWGLWLLHEARRHAADPAAATALDPWLARLPAPDPPPPPPIAAHLDAGRIRQDPGLLARSAELLDLPDLAGWFLDPATIQADAVEWLQAQESRLVVSAATRAERLATLVDRVLDAHCDGPARGRWQRRLEEEAFVLHASGRPEAAAVAWAAALALGDPARPARDIPFLRALVEKSLTVAGEVATGRLPASALRRAPRRSQEA